MCRKGLTDIVVDCLQGRSEIVSIQQIVSEFQLLSRSKNKGMVVDCLHGRSEIVSCLSWRSTAKELVGSTPFNRLGMGKFGSIRDSQPDESLTKC